MRAVSVEGLLQLNVCFWNFECLFRKFNLLPDFRPKTIDFPDFNYITARVFLISIKLQLLMYRKIYYLQEGYRFIVPIDCK